MKPKRKRRKKYNRYPTIRFENNVVNLPELLIEIAILVSIWLVRKG